MIGVLIVDDDFMVARVHAGFVSGLPGFRVVGTAATGATALAEIDRLRPDLVLLDVYLPDMTGLDVLRQIRATERLSSVKVLLLTARARDTDVDDGYSTGADEYVTKPFSPRELLHRVNSLLGRGR